MARNSSDHTRAGGDGVTPWRPPSIDRPGAAPTARGGVAASLRPPTAGQIESWQKEAREAGFQRGYEEGLAAGREAAAEQARAGARRLADIAESLAGPLRRFDEAAERELVQLALTLARQMVRRELRTDPGEIVPVVREALGLLPSNARRVNLHLHPDDLELVREHLNLGDLDGGLHLVEDPLISRGGCHLDAEPTQIDATLETRLKQLAVTVLGGERECDQ